MDQSARMSKEPSRADHTPESALIPHHLPPKTPKTPATEKNPDPVVSRSGISSPVEPFPEFDLEVGAEPNPSPKFVYEADTRISPTDLSLPGPALRTMRELETGPLVIACVKWEEGQESEEERGDMKEATARALEWAKKMFGKDAERIFEGGEESGHGSTE